jgi:hypothetical protein
MGEEDDVEKLGEEKGIQQETVGNMKRIKWKGISLRERKSK